MLTHHSQPGVFVTCYAVCAAGKFSLPGSTTCTDCPVGSSSTAGSSGCSCTSGFALFNGVCTGSCRRARPGTQGRSWRASVRNCVFFCRARFVPHSLRGWHLQPVRRLLRLYVSACMHVRVARPPRLRPSDTALSPSPALHHRSACNGGSYSAAQASTCTSCPSNSASAANSSTCTCTTGYSQSGSGSTLACTSTSSCDTLAIWQASSLSQLSDGLAHGPGPPCPALAPPPRPSPPRFDTPCPALAPPPSPPRFDSLRRQHVQRDRRVGHLPLMPCGQHQRRRRVRMHLHRRLRECRQRQLPRLHRYVRCLPGSRVQLATL